MSTAFLGALWAHCAQSAPRKAADADCKVLKYIECYHWRKYFHLKIHEPLHSPEELNELQTRNTELTKKVDELTNKNEKLEKENAALRTALVGLNCKYLQ